jgi:hypothetical protein
LSLTSLRGKGLPYCNCLQAQSRKNLRRLNLRLGMRPPTSDGQKRPRIAPGLWSFEGLHPPFIDLTLMSRRGAVHCLHTYRWPRLETGPRHQQNCADCHKENARPVRSEPQESHAAPWRLQSVSNRPRGIRAAKRSPPNSGARHVQDSAENQQRTKSHEEHSRLSIHRCHAHNRT